MNLSQIKDLRLKNEILRIASLDGENSKQASINKQNEYKELCNILNGNYSRKLNSDETEVLLGLKIEYEQKYNINKNSNNKAETRGNCVIGDGNAVGGDNSTNISGNNNNIIIVKSEKEAEEITNKITRNQKTTGKDIDLTDEEEGAVLATNIYDEVNSSYALNNVIKTACNNVGKLTAYSFFKEYKALNHGRSKLMQDIYGVSDIFNRINAVQAKNLIKALLEQASSLNARIEQTKAYKNLQEHLKTINCIGNKDPDDNYAIQLDKAVEKLLEEMADEYNDNL